MTAEPDLLPLPEPTGNQIVLRGDEFQGDYNFYVSAFTGDQLEAYARANVARAIAAKDAEVEALRAEVDEWKDVAKCASEQQDSLFREARALNERANNLRAEVERLTFEMERLQQQYDERTACMIVHRGTALACSDAVRAAYSEEHERAERLAKERREFAKPEMAIGLYTEDRND